MHEEPYWYEPSWAGRQGPSVVTASLLRIHDCVGFEATSRGCSIGIGAMAGDDWSSELMFEQSVFMLLGLVLLLY